MSGRKFSVHWLCWQPTPYNDFLFRSLASEPEIDLIVHFICPVVSSHPWRSPLAHGYNARYYQKTFGLDGHLLRLASNDWAGFFVVAGWHDPTMQIVMTILALRRRPFAVWTDTPDLSTPRLKLKAILRAEFLKWIFGRASYVLGTGQPALQTLIQMGCPKEKLVNFPFFVDLDLWSARRGDSLAKTDARPLKFVSSGRLLNVMKGHDVALSALALAQQRAGHDHIEYSIIGTGPDLPLLREQVRQLKLDDYVKFLGWLEPEQIVRLYPTRHVLLHPSRYDPFPVTVLEAMAAGMLVCGSDACGSVADRIQHGENGYVHRAGNVDDLAGQITHVLLHPECVMTIGAKARRTAEDWPVSRGVQTIKSLVAKLHE